MRRLDPNSPTPAIRQIADALRDAIQSGEFGSGDRIPGQVTLVAHFGVAKGTVDTAINALKAEGLLVGRQGAGVFVRAGIKDGGRAGEQRPAQVLYDSDSGRLTVRLNATDDEQPGDFWISSVTVELVYPDDSPNWGERNFYPPSRAL